MIFTLFKKELLDHIQKFRFTFITILAIVLIVVCTVLNVENYRQKLENYNSVIREHKKSLEETMFNVYSWLTPIIEYKPEVFEILSKGITGQFASTVEVRRTKMPEFKAGSTVDNEYLVTVSEIDISRVIAIIFSLLGLLLGFDAINGERRNGTLKHILANQVPRYKLLLSKCLGGIAIISLSLLIGFIFCLILMINSPSIALNTGDWMRIGGFLVSSLLYATTFYMLGILLSVSVREPATALAFSLFFWVILVIIWPVAARYIGKQLIPVPSYEYLQKMDGFEYFDPEDFLKLYGDFMKAGKSASRFSLSNTGSLVLLGRSNIDKNVLDYLFERVDNVEQVLQEQTDRKWQIRSAYNSYLMKQHTMIHFISCFSPAYLYDYASSIFCRTGISSYQNFIYNVREYRRQLLQWLIDIDAMHSEKWFVLEGDLDLTGLPEFSLNQESFIEILYRAMIPLSVLIIIIMTFFFCSHIIFYRSNV